MTQRSPVDVEILLPSFNESARLPRTLAALVRYLSAQSWTSRIVVVDNGSSDDTGTTTVAVTGSAVQVTVIGCARPGKGAAVLRGLRTSRARFVCFADADLSTPVETLQPAIAALQAGAAAAIASRYAPGARLAIRQPPVRRFGGAMFRRLARPVVPDVWDTQCGFKCFDRHAVAAAVWKCRSTGFAFDVELLHHIADGGGRIVEVPVIWTDDRRSSLRPMHDGAQAVLSLLRLRRELGLRPAVAW